MKKMLGFLVMLIAYSISLAQQPFIVVASTTSTEQSGLFKHLLPIYGKVAKVQVRVVALGTGQALDLARRGDADVAFVHDTDLELKFVADGHAIGRREVMFNDFVLIGPKKDGPRIAGGKDIVEAMRRIAASNAAFVSRGDRSGTHAAELRLWSAAGIDPQTGKGIWYRETGSGMGPALNTASAMNAYLLSDRGTWISFRNRGELTIAVEGDKSLFNQYGAMLANPARHAHIKAEMGRQFIEWLVSEAGQKSIAAYRIEGQQLFFPNASPGR